MDVKSRRAVTLATTAIARLNLNLSGYTVLTEVGSNNYLFSPIIPLLAGAKEVYAFSRTTPYGSSEVIKSDCENLARDLNLFEKLTIRTEALPIEWFNIADIVTNSGMLRPLDEAKLMHLRPGAVIPLMYEAWELRESDLDIGYCRTNNIAVAGTWENHPDIEVFKNVGMLALKMAFEAGYEVLNNKVIVWSDDEFGEEIIHSFGINGANCILTTNFQLLIDNILGTDFIFVADYDEMRSFSEIWDLDKLTAINPNIGIVHLFGDFKKEEIENKKIGYFPSKDGLPRIMSFTLGHVGLKPIINLQVAGYKVAQELLENSLSSISQPIS
ncbi:MAG: hypothetical protein ACO1NS_02620 [Daejeonella sp.]